MGAAVELDAFLADGLERQVHADSALHDGDAAPRVALWSHNNPVTLFGAHVPVARGWTDLEEIFRWLAGRFSQSKTFDVELVAVGVSGDLAYTVGFEHSQFSLDGVPVAAATLRVTHIYRQENGQWRIVHRHAGRPPADRRS